MSKGTPLAAVLLLAVAMSGCAGPESGQAMVQEADVQAVEEAPEYFLLRPEVEKAYGYTHAIRIGNDIKISGAVSMDDQGNPTAVGDLEQQMKNAYADLEKVLQHYGYTFDDVIVEDVNKCPLFCTHWSASPVVTLVPHLFGVTAFRQELPPVASVVWAAEKLMPAAYRNSPILVIHPHRSLLG